ncbi:mediator of RNA polymerase II transcription subunit 26 isoform X2 [Solea senegalensis]|uniref:Mediator of RNA polymerase II transcription subunit 26 n=1 Tax=Solea senegalensis TaxID=28829 RepID=A0AAV6S810_SOLSE|nr:mediator of RNA polymerase II transcription subunit 26-like isoform X1 [Solea senegalensis]KAG7513539.1 mediator of RNA polymerase II transcription subunit 26 isoform X2 [Solea senegalensis]
MTATPATPQVMRDRLLQAVDGQSNICNMGVVVEVISFLEKYPITKEALEETRLGKLINEVRKKTNNEDLARRAKKLLRNWQKLIEPEEELISKEHTGASWSSSCGVLTCMSLPTATTPSCKTGPELKNRNNFNNCHPPRFEKTENRKCKGVEKEGKFLPAKISKRTLTDKIQNSKQLPSKEKVSSSDMCTDFNVHRPLDRDISESLDGFGKIPVNAVQPHPSVLGHSKPSSLLKASVLQQQSRSHQAATGGQYRPRSPHGSLHSPQTPIQEAIVKKTATQPQSLSSLTVRPGPVNTFGLGPFTQPLSVGAQGCDHSQSTDVDSQSRLPNVSNKVGLEDNGPLSNIGEVKRQKCRHMVKLDVHTVEDSTKPVRLKDRKLLFDPVSGKIKHSLPKEVGVEKAVKLGDRHEPQCSEQLKLNSSVPSSPLQHNDWKELSRSKCIQSYLSHQSSVLTLSGAYTPGAHFVMTEFLKPQEHQSKDTKKTHMLTPEIPAKDLPGISREIVNEDLSRIHTQHWPGVNGCYDTKSNWYDWSQCISLDLHGDESRLNILPYVCLE